MKIQFNYPRGYLSEMTQAREEGNFDQWVNSKFGDRIKLLISDDFTIDIQEQFFIVDFTYEDDGFAFISLIGGREVAAS